MDNFQSAISFDGLWLDSNEAMNYCDGVCYSNQASQTPVRQRLRFMPTTINLESQTLSLDCWSFNYTNTDYNNTNKDDNSTNSDDNSTVPE